MAISTLNHLSLTNYTQLPTIYDNNDDDDMSTITTSQQVSQITPLTINNNVQESSMTISSNPFQSNVTHMKVGPGGRVRFGTLICQSAAFELCKCLRRFLDAHFWTLSFQSNVFEPCRCPRHVSGAGYFPNHDPWGVA